MAGVGSDWIVDHSFARRRGYLQMAVRLHWGREHRDGFCPSFILVWHPFVHRGALVPLVHPVG